MPIHPRHVEDERFPRPHDQNFYHDFAQRPSPPTIHETATRGYPVGIPGRVDQYDTHYERLAASSLPSNTSLQSAFCGSPWMSGQESSAPSRGMTLHGAKEVPTNSGGASFDRNTFFGPASTPSLPDNRSFSLFSVQEGSLFGNQTGQAHDAVPLGGYIRNPLLSHNPFEPNHDELLISTTTYGTFWLPHHTAGPVMDPWVSRPCATEQTSDGFGHDLPPIQVPQVSGSGSDKDLSASEQLSQELKEICQKLRALEDSRAQRGLDR